MLEPQGRQLLLDALRPPAGYELDIAIGTTYSLDLTSLLAAPLGFALFDRESSEGRLVADPIALVQAVRRYADKITIFSQAGQIAIPREYRTILTYLEPSVCEVVPPDRDAIFHPKVWAIRYSRPDDGKKAYRLLCLSRNLTFDRAWDTMLRLEGESGTDGTGDRRLARFIERLPALATRPLASERQDAVGDLAQDLLSVRFAPPPGFDSLAFWPMGLGIAGNPLEHGRVDRLLVISPFLTAGMAESLGQKGRNNTLVSRTEAFDLVGARAIARFAETLTLNPTAFGSEAPGDDSAEAQVDAPVDEALAERPDVELRGLHAKLYVADAPYRGRVWTGSANATDAGFGANVEFLVELEGRKADCGVEAVIGDRKDGFRKLLEPYRPEEDDPRELTGSEQVERRLDLLRRRVAGLRFTARAGAVAPDGFSLVLEIAPQQAQPHWWDTATQDAQVRFRPLTLGDAYLKAPMPVKKGRAADFGTVSFERLTSFFVVDMALRLGEAHGTAAFVINAELLGAPSDRRERTLVTLLENRKELIRFLLLLLGQVGADDLSKVLDLESGSIVDGDSAWLFVQWQALFEPMVRALAAEPGRLDEIARLVGELESTEAGKRLLPPGWRGVWDPIWQAREGLRPR